MIRKLILLVGAGFLARKLIDRSRSEPTTGSPKARFRSPQPSSGSSSGHVPSDLLGDSHPDGTVRAEDHYRPDPTASVRSEDRESLRPVTFPAPHDAPGR